MKYARRHDTLVVGLPRGGCSHAGALAPVAVAARTEDGVVAGRHEQLRVLGRRGAIGEFGGRGRAAQGQVVVEFHRGGVDARAPTLAGGGSVALLELLAHEEDET